MGAVADREKAFQDAFNSMLGNKIGRPLKPYKDYQPSDKVLADLYKVISQGRKAQKELSAPKTSGGGKKSSKGEPLTDEQKKARQKEFLKDSGVTKEGNRGFFDKFKDVVGRTMDVISRPGYTVTGALYEQAKAMAEGEPFWSTFDELGYGGWRGASGQAKHGAGDVLRETKKGRNYKGGGLAGFINDVGQVAEMVVPLNPLQPMSVAAQISKALPKGAEKWFDRGVGLVGDIAYDPLTWASGGTELVAKNLGKTVIKNVAEESTKKIVRQAVAKGGRSAKHADTVADRVAKKLDDLSLDIEKGGQKGRKVGGVDRNTRKTLSHDAGEGWRTQVVDDVRVKGDQVTAAAKTPGGANYRRVNGWAQTDPHFKIWNDTFRNHIIHLGRTAVAKDYDEAAKAGYLALSDSLKSHVDDIVNSVEAGLKTNLVKAPALKIGGKTIAKSEKLGEVMARMGDKVASGPLDEVFKSLSYGRGNPGVALKFGGKTRSSITHRFKKLFEEVEVRGRQVSKEDARTIQEALQDGKHLADPVLEGHRQWLRDKYDEIYKLEEEYGLRGMRADKQNMPNYVYTHFKSNSVQTKAFRDKMRESVRKTQGYNGYTLQDAINAGAKPETNAFNNLLARQIKANRDIAPIDYARQLNQTFGVKGVLTRDEINRRGLIEVKSTSRELPPSIAASLKPGEKMYLTPDANQMLERYRKFADTGSAEHAQLLHTLDYVTNKFKRSATLYYPSFHIRNFIGDMYVGAIDGVGIRDYIKIFNKWKKGAASEINVGGINKRFDELVEVYETNLASSGHLLQEVGKGKPFTRISGKVGDWAEKREDFGRFTHFVHALDEELKGTLKKYADPDKAWDKAVDAATYRVNKYKLDYSALTNMEQKYLKRAIPFYTYPRKMISTLAEATVMSPRQLSNTAHIMDNWQKYADKNNPGFNAIGMPGWMRDSPVIPFSGGGSPLGFDVGSLLPMQGATDWMQNPLANVNPVFRSIPEMTYGKNAFTHADVKNPWDAILQNVRPYGEYKRATKDTPGVVKISNFLGVPIRKVSAGQQDAQIQSLIFKAKGQVSKMDEAAQKQGYHVYYSERSDGITVRIQDTSTEEVIGEFDDIPSAKEGLKQILG